MADRGRYTPAAILRRIVKLAEENRSQAEIARLLNLSRDTVRKYFPSHVARRKRGRGEAKPEN